MQNYENYTHRNQYEWNVVYNFVMKIKDKALTHGVNIYDNSISFKDIIKKVGTKKDVEMASILQFNRFKNFLLVRYGKYSDILSGENDITMDSIWDMYDGFYRECRSIVIDIKEEEIVLCPFPKFRNLNEGEENSLKNIMKKIKECSSFEVSNKLDGSMQSATWYANSIVMAGSQAIDMSDSWRLQDGYNMLINNNNYVNMIKCYPTLTFIFEYISLKDAHVVKYKKEDEGLYLIGIRNKSNGEIYSYKDILHFANMFGVKTTSVFDKKMDDILEDVKKYKSDEMEGFVLNIDGFLLKVKCDDYVDIHKTISHLSSVNGIIKAIAEDRFDDFISKIPEAYRERVYEVSKIVFSYLYLIEDYVSNETEYCKYKFSTTKDFMIYADSNYPKFLKGYIVNAYLGRKNNYIKSGNEKCPHYKKLSEIKELTEWLKENNILLKK